jgi:hypothetical protein
MADIRFPISDETNKKLMQIKGGSLKKAYAKELFEKAVNAEHKKQNKAK